MSEFFNRQGRKIQQILDGGFGRRRVVIHWVE